MNIIETTLPGVLLIEPRIFSDERGFFMKALMLIATINTASTLILYKIIFPIPLKMYYEAYITNVNIIKVN